MMPASSGDSAMSKQTKTVLQNSLRERLRDQGAQLTAQRSAVFDFVSGVDSHPTAEEVFLAVKRKLPRISLATVYKNLEALVGAGLITKLNYGDASARYDIRTDHHYHTRCLGCGEVGDLNAPDDGEALKQIKPAGDFQVKDYRLELLGYCRECRN